jgi:hypothetical protein
MVVMILKYLEERMAAIRFLVDSMIPSVIIISLPKKRRAFSAT